MTLLFDQSNFFGKFDLIVRFRMHVVLVLAQEYYSTMLESVTISFKKSPMWSPIVIGMWLSAILTSALVTLCLKTSLFCRNTWFIGLWDLAEEIKFLCWAEECLARSILPWWLTLKTFSQTIQLIEIDLYF